MLPSAVQLHNNMDNSPSAFSRYRDHILSEVTSDILMIQPIRLLSEFVLYSFRQLLTAVELLQASE